MTSLEKQSVSVAVCGPDDSVLIVLRPPDDEDLPNAWGLPASSLKEGESWEDAVRRTAREKLGVEVEVGRELCRGFTDRAAFRLSMRLYEARITSGEPAVRQDVHGITHYVDWTWGAAEALVPAAGRGSLCCRLYLEAVRSSRQ